MSDQPATVILSLDCEGRWGAADRGVTPRDVPITDEGLDWTYRTLLQLLDRYAIPATFAVVGTFALGPEQSRELRGPLEESPAHRRWLAAADRRMAAGGTTGWYLPDLVPRVAAFGMHEVASHGACHLPLGGADVDDAALTAEVAAVRRAGELLGVRPRTFVFPRNVVAGTAALAATGVVGHRAAASDGPGSPAARIRRLADEFAPRPRSEVHPTPREGESLPIPAGIVMNWRSGARRVVPRRVSVARWQRLLADAVATGGGAHLWLHPHNLLTGARQVSLLEAQLAAAAALVRDGRARAVTQATYCAERATAHGPDGSTPASTAR